MQQITKSQYYQLLGLQVLAVEYDKKLRDLQNSVVSIVQEKSRDGSPITLAGDGWSGEFVYCPDAHTVDEFLSLMKIEVVDE